MRKLKNIFHIAIGTATITATYKRFQETLISHERSNRGDYYQS